jgi:hypothetical protein
MTKLIVVHDSAGHVIALGEVPPGPFGNVGVGVVPTEG